MITATVIGVPETIRNIEAQYPKIKDKLLQYHKSFALKTAGYIQTRKLSGQVLHQRSGNLKTSINQRIMEDSKGIMILVGTNMEYAAIHEFGFSGTENVKGHTRKVKGRDVKGSFKSFDIYEKRIVLAKGICFVRPFTRNINMPGRSFLRSSLEEKREEYRAGIRQILNEALQK